MEIATAEGRFTADVAGPAPYRFEVVPDAGHFVTDQAPAAVTRLLLAHLAAYRR
jgi:pimeloyl-ACP methyl ester carboxylesterase